MKKNSTAITLSRNHRKPHHPVLNIPSLIWLIPNGARHPPRNKVTATAETLTMLMYSARKNIANFMLEYSVWNPPTNSPSASGRSKGARLVSPTIETRYTMNDGSRMIPNQNCSCAATMPEVDMVPANSNTATNDSPMASSYEIT